MGREREENGSRWKILGVVETDPQHWKQLIWRKWRKATIEKGLHQNPRFEKGLTLSRLTQSLLLTGHREE